jgi:hypothetical protein
MKQETLRPIQSLESPLLTKRFNHLTGTFFFFSFCAMLEKETQRKSGVGSKHLALYRPIQLPVPHMEGTHSRPCQMPAGNMLSYIDETSCILGTLCQDKMA